MSTTKLFKKHFGDTASVDLKHPNIESFFSELNNECLVEDSAKCHPSIERGKVWCRTCEREEKVNPSHCLKNGWPKCCGYTMTIDHPDTWKKKNS